MQPGLRKTLVRGCNVIPQRYILAIMGFLAVGNAYTMRICLSIAITEMVIPRNTSSDSPHYDPDACPVDEDDNSQNNSTEGKFDWDQETQGLILGAFFWGYVITHVPGGILAEKFGGKYSLGLGILSTALLSLLTPLAARAGAEWLIALRFFEGLGEGTTFPALNTLLAQWVPAQERGKLGSLVFAGALIGTVVGTAVSGAILTYTPGQWENVFYLFGGLSVLWFIVWTMVCYNDPASHPFITDEEKKFLEEAMSGNDKEKKAIPWRAIMTSVPLWGLICAQVGHDWGFFTMVTDLPKYMKDVMKFTIAKNAVLSAIPYLAMWLISIGSGWIADWMITTGKMNTTNTRKLFTTIASIGPGIGIIAASYAGCDSTAVVTLFTVAMALMGTFYPGMKVNALDLSPNFAGTLMALVNGIGGLTGIAVPYLIGVLTPNTTLLEWRVVFWITLGVLIVTNAVFLVTASGEIQPWNNIIEKKLPEEGACTYMKSCFGGKMKNQPETRKPEPEPEPENSKDNSTPA